MTYNPVRRELLHACRGQGAFCNDQPIHVSATSHLPGALVLASRSETGRGEWERFRDILTVRPMGSVAYKLAQVAQGKCDMTFSLVPKNEWDICAGTLLVTEAGGQVTDLQGQPFASINPRHCAPVSLLRMGTYTPRCCASPRTLRPDLYTCTSCLPEGHVALQEPGERLQDMVAPQQRLEVGQRWRNIRQILRTLPYHGHGGKRAVAFRQRWMAT